MQMSADRLWGSPAGLERPRPGQQPWGRTESQVSHTPKVRLPLLWGHPSPILWAKAAAGNRLLKASGPLLNPVTKQCYPLEIG